MKYQIIFGGLMVLGSLAVQPPDLGAAVTPAFTPNQAHLVYSDGTWAVWKTKHVVPGTERHCASSYNVCYYRQKLDSRDAPLALELQRTTSWPDVKSVLDDGTLLLSCRGLGLALVSPQSKTKFRGMHALGFEGKGYNVVGGFCDGVLLQPRRLNESAPVYFVPIVNRKLRYAKKQMVTVGPGVSVSSPPHFIRSGDWLAYDNCLFNLRTHERRQIAGVERKSRATAADAETVVFWCGGHYLAISVSDGKRVWFDPGPNKCVFAVKANIGYFFDSDIRRHHQRELRAVDLGKKSLVSPALLTVRFSEDRRILWDHRKIPHIITDQAMLIWNGKEWATIE
ncbi:MAG: hypothetical protein K8R46_01870 [Pirellulales bacterium]|nr:hypothetical protein [Pirellulales bacterium]